MHNRRVPRQFGLSISIYEQLRQMHIHPECQPDGEPYLKERERKHEKVDRHSGLK